MQPLTLTLVVLCITSVIATPLAIQPRLVGGTATVRGQFPSTVFIDTPQQMSCVGVIVNLNHVLTSCQCVLDSNDNTTNPFFVRIIAGDLNIFSPTYQRFTTRASRIFVHPLYNRASGFNDIAVIRVLTAFSFPHNTIDPAPRNARVLADGTMCVFAGWGNDALGNFNGVQQSLNQPILNRDLCNAATVHANRVTENMICAGHLAAFHPPAGVCQGNTGGGLFCRDELVGILSFGMGCGMSINPAVYTQVRFFETWIIQQFARN